MTALHTTKGVNRQEDWIENQDTTGKWEKESKGGGFIGHRPSPTLGIIISTEH